MRFLALVMLVGCGGSTPAPAPNAPVAPIAINNSATPAKAADDGVKITGLEPAKGDDAGGTYVTLKGNRLLPIAQKSVKVYFGSQQGEVVRIASDSELIVQAPAGKAGEVVDVLVSFEGGEIKLPKAFTYVAKP